MRTVWGKSVPDEQKELLIRKHEAASREKAAVFVGRVFIPHGTDSRGRVVAVSPTTVRFAYDHAPGVEHSMFLSEFTSFFARWSGEGLAW